MVKAGALEAKPAAIVRFLKDQSRLLEPAAVGEYLGHQDDLPVRGHSAACGTSDQHARLKGKTPKWTTACILMSAVKLCGAKARRVLHESISCNATHIQ